MIFFQVSIIGKLCLVNGKNNIIKLLIFKKTKKKTNFYILQLFPKGKKKKTGTLCIFSKYTLKGNP